MSTPEEPPAKRKKFSLNFFKETVKVVVGKGQDEVEISVPKDRLCEVSEFFKAGCSDRWASGREGVITLEEESPKIFGIFLAWAFDGGIMDSEDYIFVEGMDAETRKSSTVRSNKQLIECFLLGQKLLAPDFRNEVVDLIIKNCYLSNKNRPTTSGLTSNSSIIRIYANTIEGSPLRRILVDIISSKRVRNFTSRCQPDYTCDTFKYFEEYWLELLTCLSRSRRIAASSKLQLKRDRCDYHEHPGKPAGYSCTKEKHYPTSGWIRSNSLPSHGQQP